MQKGYIPQLEALRGVAVSSVLAFHLGVFPAGWMGVPLFFVLSGYLITGGLLATRDKPDYFRNFFWKRSVRILPLYYAYLVINACLLVAMGKSLDGYGWYLAYLGNIAVGIGQGTGVGATGHLWSLAVEQQFYFLWPIIVILFRRVWIAATIAFVAAPLSREILLVYTNPYVAITSLPSCMDMLAAGAIVACTKDRRVFAFMTILGTALLAYCMVQISFWDLAHTEAWASKAHLLYSAVALLAGPLVATAHKVPYLKFSPLEWIGKISYSMYIWQLMVILILERLHVDGVPFVVLGVVITTIISWLSWRLIEQPFLKLKSWYPWKRHRLT